MQLYELLHSEHLNKLCQTAVANFLIICAFLYILALNSKHLVVSFLVRSVAARLLLCLKFKGIWEVGVEEAFIGYSLLYL